MIALAIDTSSTNSSLAIFDDEKIIASVQHHTHKLQTGFFQIIEKTMTDLNIVPKGVGKVIVGIGPGSFTGVRVGVSLARTFCQLTQAELLSVRSYFFGFDEYQKGAYYIPVIPSTRTECYASLFRVTESGKIETIHEIDDGGPVRILQWLSRVPENSELFFYGEGVEMLSKIEFTQSIRAKFCDSMLTKPSAERAFKLLRNHTELFEHENPLVLKPLYVRPSPAEIHRIEGKKSRT